MIKELNKWEKLLLTSQKLAALLWKQKGLPKLIAYIICEVIICRIIFIDGNSKPDDLYK